MTDLISNTDSLTLHRSTSNDNGSSASRAAPDHSEALTAAQLTALRKQFQHEILAAVDFANLDSADGPELRNEIVRVSESLSRKNARFRQLPDWDEVVARTADDAVGFGPIEELLRDPTVSDILVNGPRQVFVERAGRLHASDVAFRDEQHLMQVIERIALQMGRQINAQKPMVDARLPDGSRVNAVIKPLALNGPVLSIRRFGTRPMTTDDLLSNGSLTEEMLEFLAAAVRGRLNIIISGGTGSGKTTLLNAISRYIPHSQRIVTIEDTAELLLQQPHVVMLESRQANSTLDEGEVSIREILKNALRMRPDRIIVGECRSAEALDMLQAMNTGHEGSLTTVHANSTREALTRLEMMIALGGTDIPVWAVRKQISQSLNIVVQVARLAGGRRCVTKISEIAGMEENLVSMHDIFEYIQTGVDEQENATGHFRITGIAPMCLPRLQIAGTGLPQSMFQARNL